MEIHQSSSGGTLLTVTDGSTSVTGVDIIDFTTGATVANAGAGQANVSINLSTGISGGQSVIGGTGASENLTLSSTTNTTKGKLLFGTSAFDESGLFLGIGNSAPTNALQVFAPSTPVGTVSVTASGTTVTGVGTRFLDNFSAGQTITANAETQTVVSVASNTSMTTSAWTNSASGVSYTIGSASTARFTMAGSGASSISGSLTMTQLAIASQSTRNGIARGAVLAVTGGTGGASTYNPGSGGVNGGAGAGVQFTTGAGGDVTSGNPSITAGAAGNFTFTTGSGGNVTGSASTTSGSAQTGGTFTVTTGSGGNVIGITGNAAAANGGAMTFGGGTGGGVSATGIATAGSGSNITFNAGAGGLSALTVSTTRNGGSGGSLLLNAGAGGNVQSATNGTNLAGGFGGAITLTAGAGGTIPGLGSGTNTNGPGGNVSLLGGAAGNSQSLATNGGSIYLLGGAKANAGNDGNVYLGKNVGGTIRGTVNTTTLLPHTTGSYDVGSTALMYGNLFLKSGGTINFNNGDFILTHSTGLLTANGNFAISKSAPEIDLTDTVGVKTWKIQVTNSGNDFIVLSPNSSPLLDISNGDAVNATNLIAKGKYNGATPLQVIGNSGQTVDLMQINDGTNNVLTVDKAGVLVAGNTIRLKGYTVATLPAGVQGDTAFVTDATAPTYLGALTGGGTVVCSVFYNGTAWVSA